MIAYNNPIIKDDKVLSVDNVVWTGYIPDPRKREQLVQSVMDKLYFSLGADVRHWSSFRIGSYREQFTVELPGDVSFWLGVGLNKGRTEWGHVCLDANPNKVAETDAFRFLLGFLHHSVRAESRKVKRFDLAIDLQVSREKCYLIKDSRAYLERRHGKEWTQYLGARASHVGRVKLYNKQVEAKLDYPLTRLELTLDPATPFVDIQFPKVYYLSNQQISMNELKITDTDNFVLNALLQGCGTVKQLGRRERAKMEKLMQHYITEVTVSPEDYSEILRQVNSYL